MNWPEPPGAGPLGDGRHALAVDRPATLDDLRQTVATRAGEGHAIYPQGGTTALDFGGRPRKPGVAVDTRGLNRVVDYPAADMTVTVEAGITLAELQAQLARENQRALLDAPHPDRATLGAIYATNTSGPRRFGAGRPRDQVIGLGFVNADGEYVKGGGRVVKNVAGYDLPRLLTGSMGTLGVIAQLTLKVRPRPERSALAWVTFDSPDGLDDLLDRLNGRSGVRPMAVELLNGPAAAAVGTPLGLPAAGWSLVVGCEDNAPSVGRQLDDLRADVGREFEVREGDAAAPLWSAMSEFQAAAPGPLTAVATLKPSSVVGFLAAADPGLWSLQAHAGSGVVRAHWLGAPGVDAVAGEVARLRAHAARDGGSLTLSHCPTDWKDRLKVWGDPRPDWALCERIKRALDPRAVMNPGRFVGTI